MKKLVMRNLRWFGSVFVLAVLAFVFLFPMFAWADDGSGSAAVPTTALEDFHTQVMAILVPVFVTLIGGLATWIGLLIKKKFHLAVSDQTMEQWNALARAAALRGAEWARAKSKEFVEGKKLPGGEVMDVAAKWAIQMAAQQGLPALGAEKLTGLIESELFKLRLETTPMPAAPDVRLINATTLPKV